MFEFDVVDLGPAETPATGDTAPDFTRPLVTEDFWEDRSLSSVSETGLEGEGSSDRTLLVFTPMVGSFMAKYIFDALTERAITETTTVVGLTISSPYESAGFLARESYDGIALFSDPANEVASQYGLVHDLDGMAGIEEPRPALFVLDTDRTIHYQWVPTDWPAFPDYDDLESALE